ncbi:MAG: PilZ domain-containing protein [Oligoflexia bacterium]|nr:PilZ domain-containing protein [Oligoflexia bacterium]
MKKKPFSIKFFATCFLLAPIFNVLLLIWVNKWPLTGPRGVLERFSLYEIIILCIFPVVAYGIWKVAKWGYYLFMVFSFFIVAHNFYILVAHRQYSSYVVLLFQVTTFSVIGFFLQKHITAPYFNPKLRWWESSPRFKTLIAASVQYLQKVYDAEVLDISKGGCFVYCNKHLNLGDEVVVEFSYNGNLFRAAGDVVWLSERAPSGFGIKFKNIRLGDKWSLAKILKDLKKARKEQLKVQNKPDIKAVS